MNIPTLNGAWIQPDPRQEKRTPRRYSGARKLRHTQAFSDLQRSHCQVPPTHRLRASSHCPATSNLTRMLAKVWH